MVEPLVTVRLVKTHPMLVVKYSIMKITNISINEEGIYRKYSKTGDSVKLQFISLDKEFKTNKG